MTMVHDVAPLQDLRFERLLSLDHLLLVHVLHPTAFFDQDMNSAMTIILGSRACPAVAKTDDSVLVGLGC